MVISLTSIIETSSENHSGNQLWRAACFAVKPKVYFFLYRQPCQWGLGLNKKPFTDWGRFVTFDLPTEYVDKSRCSVATESSIYFNRT